MADDAPTPKKPTREQILAALAAATGQGDAASQGDAKDGDSFHSRIVIKPDGEVLIENLSMDLMELALLLDPDAEMACDLPESATDADPDTDRDDSDAD